ncbi:FMN-linked oxidoreductase [Gautieria morchelliformis]|nr:FMN-linked oxidoreductase [Gautieria morchelliformis]
MSSATYKPPFLNTPVPNEDQFYPLNDPPIGATYPPHIYPQNLEIPPLLRPITIRGVTFKNRIFVSPMCQYSSDNGHASDWHLVHIGGFAARGAGAICMEATGVVPEGRISPEDAGLWTDTQIPPLQRIVHFAHTQGTQIGVQLGHAGRKGSTLAPWVISDMARTRSAGRHVALEDENGWPNNVWAPSEIPFSNEYPKPKAATEEYLDYVEKAFIDAVERCKQIGYDFIELHGAHGYFFHQFMSPLSNIRTDKWGGQPLENRLRFVLRVVRAVRAVWDKPLLVRISATDWAEGPEKVDGEWKQWGIEQSTILVGELQKLGVDLIDVSSGGNWVKQKITLEPGYQVPFAARIKHDHPTLPIGSVGLITDPHQANSYIKDGKADVIFLARELLRRADWPLWAAQELGAVVKVANQYERAWMEMLKDPRKN